MNDGLVLPFITVFGYLKGNENIVFKYTIHHLD